MKLVNKIHTCVGSSLGRRRTDVGTKRYKNKTYASEATRLSAYACVVVHWHELDVISCGEEVASLPHYTNSNQADAYKMLLTS